MNVFDHLSFNSFIYALVSATVMVYVAHHTGSSDAAVAFLMFLAQVLHVPVTGNGNGKPPSPGGLGSS